MSLRGTCQGAAMFQFFSQDTPCKRTVDVSIMKATAKRVLSADAKSLVIVGAKPDQHIMDQFYGYGMRNLTILERDNHMADHIRDAIKKHSLSKRISLIHADAKNVHYGNFHHIDLDLMGSVVNQHDIVKRAIGEQSKTLPGRMKVFIFTQSVRVQGGNELYFQYINEIVGTIGASLKGFNGEVGKCRKGKPVITGIGERVYCRENIPDFSFMGRLRNLKCFSYRDKNHSGMVTTMLLYR
jgi:hypothetical protein